MFDDDKEFETEIRLLLDLYGDDLDKLFDELDITVERVLEVLFEGGHACVPPYINSCEPSDEDETLTDE